MKKLNVILIAFLMPMLAFGQSNWQDIVVPNKVNEIFETNTTLWMATEGGLMSVDKQNNAVQQFTKAQNGLPSNRVESIAMDNSGNLWIGTYEMGLARFDGTTWTSIDYPSNIANAQTFSIEFDQNNTAWIGTSAGLVEYDGTTWEVYNSSNTGVNFFNLVWDVKVDTQGDVIMITDNTVLKFDGTTWTDLVASNINLNLYGDTRFSDTENDKFIFSTHLNKVGIYENGALTFHNLSAPDFPYGEVLAVGFDSNEIPHVSVKDEGVYKFNNGVWSMSSVAALSSFNSGSITTLYTDENANLWLANNSSFEKLTSGAVESLDINTTGLQYNRINKVHHYNTDAFVLNGSSINRVQLNTGWTELPAPPLSTLAINGLQHLEITENGEYWASGGSWELHHWNGQNWTTYSYINSSMPLANIRAMQWNPQDEALWLATTSGIVKVKNGQFTIYDNTNTPVFGNDDARTIQVFNNEIYASIDQHLYKFNGTTWSDLATTNTDYIISLQIDLNGNIWAGHWAGGLSRYENNTWSDVTELQNYRIEDMAEDANGRLYFGTEENGLVVFDGTNWTNLTEQNSDLNYNAILDLSIDSKNQVWIGTEKGLNIYSPDGPVSNKDVQSLSEVSFSVFPNPMVQQATVEFTLENSQDVSMDIYNVKGQLVQSIVTSETKGAGIHQLTFEKGNLGSGLYLVQLRIGHRIQTTKILIQE